MADWRHRHHLHRDSVARVLAQAGLLAPGLIRRPSAINPYLPFIRETLAQFPRFRASRLYAMVKDRGYSSRPDLQQRQSVTIGFQFGQQSGIETNDEGLDFLDVTHQLVEHEALAVRQIRIQSTEKEFADSPSHQRHHICRNAF